MLVPTFSFLFCCIPEVMRAQQLRVGIFLFILISAVVIILKGRSIESGK